MTMTWPPPPTPFPSPLDPGASVKAPKSKLRVWAEILGVVGGIAGLIMGPVGLWIAYQAWQHPVVSSTAGAAVPPVTSGPGPQTSPSTPPTQPPVNPPSDPPGGPTTGSPDPPPSPPKDPAASPPTGDSGLKGGSGRDGEQHSGPSKLPSGDKPFSIESGQGSSSLPIKITGSPPGDQDGSSSGQVSVGEIIYVTAKCHGAKPVKELRLPALPRKDMKSSLSGKEIVCLVTVTTEGRATADCGQDSEIPSLLIAEAKRIVEATPWTPSKDEGKELCEDQVTVKFPWS
jgi:hypothetical protein